MIVREYRFRDFMAAFLFCCFPENIYTIDKKWVIAATAFAVAIYEN